MWSTRIIAQKDLEMLRSGIAGIGFMGMNH
jgi:hypothetical protein